MKETNTEKWKDVIQYTTAVIAFISGVTLAFVQYIDSGDLTNGVLGYVAQVLVYAASIFGVTMYWNGKYKETMNVVDRRYSELEQEIKHDIRSSKKAGTSSK